MKQSYSFWLEKVFIELNYLPYFLFLKHYFVLCVFVNMMSLILFCSDKLSFQFLAPVFSLISVFQHTVEVSFSGLFCRRLSLNVDSNPPVTYVSYRFFLNCGHFVSKSMKIFYCKKRLNSFGRTCWKLNKMLSIEYPLLHYAAEILSYLHT